jgi:hypothetical protein
VGYDGSKIERELGFKYKYKDNPRATFRDAAQSLIDLGFAKCAFYLVKQSYANCAFRKQKGRSPLMYVVIVFVLLYIVCWFVF